mgnify:CR=1 FL=1|nr:AraC family transcriptional regulator [uncultured Gemmiger sp.]
MENMAQKPAFRGARMFILPTEALEEYAAHPLVARLYLTDVGCFPRAKNHTRIRREGIEEYILLYCAAGRGTVQVGDRAWQLTPGTAFCIPRGAPHRYAADAADPWTLLWVHFKGGDTRYYPLDECRLLTPSAQVAGRMNDWFDLLFEALEGEYSLENFVYLSQVLGLILAGLYRRTAPDSSRLTRAVRWMYAHLGESLTLDRLCRELGMSKSGLNALFRQYAHRPPLQFFTRLKMTEAGKMLRQTDLPVREIARRLGYADPYYFSRAFRKTVGTSPTAYRGQAVPYAEDENTADT